MSKQLTWIVGWLLFLSGCSGVKIPRQSEFSDGNYRYREDDGALEKVYVFVDGDSTLIFPRNSKTTPLVADPLARQTFLRSSFDLDVFSIGFKYRPVAANLPRQVTSNFNAGLFVGFRQDRFRVKKSLSPFGLRKDFRHSAISVGGIIGMGGASLTPTTTNFQITEEYTALIVTRGLSLLIGNDEFTAGVAVGWDQVTDRDQHVWNYQNQPWYGLLVGFNLN